MKSRFNPRKLLIASIGVAVVNYACSATTTGNPGNPLGSGDAGADASADALNEPPPMSGNLVAPMEDAGSDTSTEADTSTDGGANDAKTD